MTKNNSESKNKKKIAIPIIASTVILGGIGGGFYAQNKLSNKTVEETSNKIDQQDEKNEGSNKIDNNNNKVYEEEIEDDNKDDEVDLDYEKDEDGNINFFEKDKKEDEGEYAHLIEQAEEKATEDKEKGKGYAHLKEQAEREAKGESKHYVSKDEDGNISFEDKDKKDDGNLVADKDGTISLPGKDKDSDDDSATSEEDIDGSNNDKDVGDDGNNSEPPIIDPEEPSIPQIPIEPPIVTDPEEPTKPEQPTEPAQPEPEYPDTDKETIIETINYAQSLNEEYYTNYSWNKVQQRLNEAIRVKNNKWSNQFRINLANRQLENAINRLVTVKPTINVQGLENVDEDGVTHLKDLMLVVNGKDYKGDKVDVKVIHNLFNKVESDDGVFPIELKKGKNTIIIIVIDEDGKKTRETIRVEYDDSLIPIKLPPKLNVGGLFNGHSEDESITFTANAKDDEDNDIEPEVTHNDNDVNSKDGNYTINLIDGENIIIVKAVNDEGVITQDKYTITYDKPEPVDEDGDDKDSEDNSSEEGGDSEDDSEKDDSDGDSDKSKDKDVVESPENEVEGMEEDETVVASETPNEQLEENIKNDEETEENEEAQTEDVEVQSVIFNGQIGNSNVEFGSEDEAKAWAEQKATERVKKQKEEGSVIWIVNPVEYGNPITGEQTFTNYTVEWIN